MKKNADIRIGVEYDRSGAEKAKADLQTIEEMAGGGKGEAQSAEQQRMAEALEAVARGLTEVAKASAEAAAAREKQTSAEREGGAAADEAAAREEAMRRQMELEGLTIKQLQAELQRLAAERGKARTAGDTAAYAKLSDEYMRARQAMTSLNQQAAINKAATMGQVQAGLQFAGTLQGLGSQLRSGQIDIAGLSNGVMALGAALKAGMGPIGLVMTGLQGLATLIEMCRDKTAELAKKSVETARAQRESAAAMQEAAAGLQEALLAPMEREAKEEERLLKLKTEREKNEQQHRLREAERERNEEMERLTAYYDKQESLIKKRIAEQGKLEAGKGNGTKTREMKALEEELYQLEKERAEKEAAMKRQMSDAAAKAEVEKAEQVQRQVEARLKQTQDQLAELKAAADPEELQALENPKINELLDRLNENQAEVKQAEAQLKDAERVREEKGIGIGDRVKSVVDGVVKAWAGHLSMAGGDAQQAQDYYKEAWKHAQGVVKSNEELEEEVRNARNVVKDGNAKRKKITQQLAKELGCTEAEAEERLGYLSVLKERTKTLEETEGEQKVELEAAKQATEGAKKDADALGKKAESDSAVAAEKQDAADAERARRKAEESAEEARRKREEEWGEVRDKSLAEQEKWLGVVTAQLKEGSEEWKKWRQESKRVARAKVSETLSRLAEDYKLTRDYAAEDKRTLSEQLAADKKALDARKRRLEELKQEPGLDAETIRKINDELKATNKKLRGWKETLEATAREAQRSLENQKTPDLRPVHKSQEGQLRRLSKAYERQVAQAERAAAQGKDKAAEQSIDRARRIALQMARISENAGAVANLYKQNKDQVQQVVAHAKKNGKYVSAEEKARQKAIDYLNKNADEAKRTADNEQRLAEETGKAADAVRTAAGGVGSGGKNYAAEAERMTQALAAQDQQLEAVAGALAGGRQVEVQKQEKLKEIQRLVTANNTAQQQVLGLMGTLAAAMTKNEDALKRRIKKLEDTIKKMQRF